MHSLIASIGFFAAATAFYTALMLALGRHRAQVRIFGGTFFFLFAAILALFTSFLDSRYQAFPHLAFVHLPVAMLTGPAVYLFLRRAADGDFPLKLRLLLHLVLPIAITVLMAEIYALPAEEKRNMLSGATPLPEYQIPRLRAIFIVAYASPLIYFSLSVRHLKPFFARSDGEPFGFLRAMRYFLLLCGIAVLLMLATLIERDLPMLKVAALMLFSLAVMVAFFELARTPHFPELLARDTRRYKRQQNRLPPNHQKLLHKMTELIDGEKLYLNDQVRVADVAQRLSMRADQLSQLINDNFGINFNRFINRLRIAEVQRRLATESKKSILRIAFECGFSAKTAFNAAFKLETGMNPSAYLKQISNDTTQKKTVRNRDSGRRELKNALSSAHETKQIFHSDKPRGTLCVRRRRICTGKIIPHAHRRHLRRPDLCRALCSGARSRRRAGR